jgi:hypothetical protein
MREGFAKTSNLTTDDTDNTDLHGSGKLPKPPNIAKKSKLKS